MKTWFVLLLGLGWLLFAAYHFAGLVGGWTPFHPIDIVPMIGGGVVGGGTVVLIARRNRRIQAEASRAEGSQ